MAPTFSTAGKRVTVTGTVDGQAYLTEGDVRAALEGVARQNGITVRDLAVSIAEGERTVTLTETEYNTLRQGGSAQ